MYVYMYVYIYTYIYTHIYIKGLLEVDVIVDFLNTSFLILTTVEGEELSCLYRSI